MIKQKQKLVGTTKNRDLKTRSPRSARSLENITCGSQWLHLYQQKSIRWAAKIMEHV